jgi:3-oxoacyl-[acyl-carrier protein] reductase
VRLEGRRALITGASGGLGSAVASAFAAEGAALALVARSEAALNSVRDRLAANGAVVHAVAADVGDAAAAEEAVRRASEALGGLDAVVNAAAIDSDWFPTGELPVEQWDAVIAVNLSGTFYVCRAALPFLAARGGRS